MLSQSPQLSASTSPDTLVEEVYRLYAALAATLPLDPHAGLGGKLLYAGEVGPLARNLVYAANIAGLASLAATADPAAQRQAMRDGVVDFVVNSLEEALRILKNEVRKHQTVSVAVAADAHKVVEQMLDRGVLPDLLPPASWMGSETFVSPAADQAAKFAAQGAVSLAEATSSDYEFVTWSLDRHAVRWLPRIDALAQAIIPEGDVVRQRWLRMAPRYLGRAAQREHGVGLDSAEVTMLREKARDLVSLHQADIAEPLSMRVGGVLLA
jgi:urocanate hydratase